MSRSESSIFSAIIASCMCFASCIAPPEPPAVDEAITPVSRDGLFSPTVTNFTLEIDYQANAAPFFAYENGQAGNPFELSERNIRALFAAARPSGPTILFPKGLADIEQIQILDPPTNGFRREDILAIASEHRDIQPTTEQRVYYVVFLDGFYNDRVSGEDPNTLGISIDDTNVIAIFKPAISKNFSPLAAHLEQITLMHELGHAMGLVNNGLSDTSAHEDTTSPKHCRFDTCVMHSNVSSHNKAIDYINDRIIGVSDASNLFDRACLDDVKAASAASSP